MWTGVESDSMTAFSVISWNVSLAASLGSIPKTSHMCHAMASPSLSGSVAKYTLEAVLAASFSSLAMFPLPRMVMYCGSKPLSISIPSLLFGRSLMWPKEAFTWYFDFVYLEMVFAFVGDSTMISGRLFFSCDFASICIHTFLT